jgi:lipopolysaccharide biosynthesis protein
LYITVCNEENNNDIRDAFKNCGAKSVNIVKVPNEGRDVAPFFSSLKNELYKSAKYDVVGHFHSKKSADSSDDVGDNWRTYLLDNLVGKRSMNNALFDLFDDAKLGLIFASDHHVVDFGENKQFANELAEAMSIEPMEFAHLFPLGTMFWARPKALSNLFELDWHKFIQPEPLPYDGSYMHASERLLPHVAKHNGFEFKSIYCKGTSW